MENIRIKYFTDKIDRLEYIDGKSDWIDLRASETVELKAGEFKLIPLGVAMQLPKGYEAHVVPRSSTFKNYGLLQVNSCGIIDGSADILDLRLFLSNFFTRSALILVQFF